MTGEDDTLKHLQDRLHVARKNLAEAYDRRDTLAREIAAIEATNGAGVHIDLLTAYEAAARAVLAGEADMKDAEHALAVAAEPRR